MENELRHVRRRPARREQLPDAALERAVERDARREHHQQHEAALARRALQLLLDRERLDDLGHALEDPVDLRGPDANAVHVEDAVAAPVQPRRALRGDLDQVSVSPHAFVLGEVGRVKPLPI